MGRVVSAVSGFAESKGASVALIQILRVPLNGLIKAMNLPSGEICAPAISGSPKNNSRSISGGWPFDWAVAATAEIASSSAAQKTGANDLAKVERSWDETLDLIKPLSFDLQEFGGQFKQSLYVRRGREVS